MGKAIRNFKDAISGVEEAKYRHIEEKNKAGTAPVAQGQSLHEGEAPVADAQASSSKSSTKS